MSNFLQLSVKLLVCGYYGAFYTHTKIPVIVLSIIMRKFTKIFFPLTSFFPFFSENFSYAKTSFLLFVFFLAPSNQHRTKANDARSSERHLHAISLLSRKNFLF